MVELLFVPESLPFAVALAFVALLFALEVVTLVFGQALSGIVDNLLPDFELDLGADVDLDAGDIDLDLDADADLQSGSATPSSTSLSTALLTWLKLDQVPALIVLITLLTTFGLCGLGLQVLFANYGSGLLPAGIAAVGSLLLSLPLVRLPLQLIARILPKDETEAISVETFIGGAAQIVQGRAEAGSPAQAKLTDQFGQTHYVLVEPEHPDAVFEQGARVLLKEKQGAVFIGVAHP